MTKAAYTTQKIFFAFGAVCTLTVFGGNCLNALDRAKARVLEIAGKVGSAKNPAITLMARGYAADETKRILKLSGVQEALITIGEAVVNIGSVRRIGLQDPFGAAGEHFSYVDVSDKAVISAGLYRKGFEEHCGSRRHDGAGLAGLTLIGDNAVELSALCNTAAGLSVGDATELLNDSGVEGILVTRSQEVSATDGLCKRPTHRQAA